jgi:uncharacterized membrane protein YgcG
MRVRHILLALLLSSSAIHARTIEWESVESDAFLDADGMLHVAEVQSILFDGDWNGGERIFPLPEGLLKFDNLTQVEGIDRLDAGVWVPLKYGNLERVDHYDYEKLSGLLRWRARAPSDPPFKQTKIVYRLRFIWPSVLKHETGNLVLNHDFAFPDREGAIRTFRTRLRLDPVWQPLEAVSHDWVEAGSLKPGQGFLRRVELKVPVNLPTSLWPYEKKAAWKLSGTGILPLLLLILLWYWRREKETGLLDQGPVDRAWMEKVFLRYPPEVIADACGGQETIFRALLARLKTQGLLDVRDGVFLRLGQGSGEDAKFLDLLFPDKRTSMAPDDIVAYRKESKRYARWDAWNVAYAWRAEHGIERYDADVRWFRRPFMWILCLFVLLLLQLPFTFLSLLETAAIGAFAILSLPWLLTPQEASVRGVVRAMTAAFTYSLLLLLVLALLPVFSKGSLAAGPVSALVIFAAILRGRSIRPHAISLRWQQIVSRGREFFEAELTRPAPDLNDAFGPYIIALDLSWKAESWQSSRTTSSTASAETSLQGAESDSERTAPTSAPSWTGGGLFGGAGASGSWAAASGAIASLASFSAASSASASAASPSSSTDSSSSSSDSGSGSDSSSSGSSGGGGGGGW